MAGFQGTIETVRGRLSDERSEQLLRFWSEQGALDEESGRGRLPEVICVALDEKGEIAGANSAYEQAVPLLGGRKLMAYRRLLAPEAADAEAEMFNAAYAALDEEFDSSSDAALGLS